MRAKTRSGFVMASHAVGNHTPNLQFLPFEEISRWVAWILGFEHYFAAIPRQALA